jgi:membrane protease YdiL (CAAX protease family)
MSPNPVDHVLAAALFLLLPLWGAWEFRRFEDAIAEGLESARLSTYRRAMAVEWVLSLALLGFWRAAGRSFARLGLDFTASVGFWLGGAVAAVASLLLVAQVLIVVRSEKKLEEVRAQLRSIESMIPRDAREARAFDALAVTAGVCEEILYRGFLMAYFTALFGPWPAAGLSTAAFALGHSYQGVSGVLKTGLVGLVMAGLLLLTGALWAPMLLHAAIDLTSGRLARRALAATPAH